MSKKTAAEQKRNPRQDTFEVQTKLGKLVCRLPSSEEWDRYLMKIKRGQFNVGKRELVQLCAVAPGLEVVQKIFERYPALPGTMFESLSEAVGDQLDTTEDEDSVSLAVDGATYRFRAPELADWEEVDTQIKMPNTEVGASMRAYLQRCFDGDASALEALLERYPAAAGKVTQALSGVAGAGFQVVAKKGKPSSGGQSATTSPQQTA